MAEDDLPLLALGAGSALAALSLLASAHDNATAAHVPSRPSPPLDPTAWVFPVPDLGDRRPEISDGWGSPRTDPDGTRRLHLGVDIMFRRRSRADLIERYPAGTTHGTRGYFLPDGVPALAASAGTVSYAAWTRRGFTVQIGHPAGWTTYYTHLSSLAVERGQAVVAGQPIGIIGHDPMDRRRLMHLHFEMWCDHSRAQATDPKPYVLAWQRRVMPGWMPPPRNAGLAYRPVGRRGERYPEWLQTLKGSSGVYVIRERAASGKPAVVYVGQSSAGRLYETLTRHFQTWRRWKGFWRGQFSEGHDPGLTYDRARAEVAVRVMPPADSLEEEARLIARLRPRDNLIGQPDDVPF